MHSARGSEMADKCTTNPKKVVHINKFFNFLGDKKISLVYSYKLYKWYTLHSCLTEGSWFYNISFEVLRYLSGTYFSIAGRGGGFPSCRCATCKYDYEALLQACTLASLTCQVCPHGPFQRPCTHWGGGGGGGGEVFFWFVI